MDRVSVKFGCNEMGEWFPDRKMLLSEPLQCRLEICVPPPTNLADNSVRSDKSKSFSRGDYIQYTCPKGLYYNETRLLSIALVCETSGLWNPQPLDHTCLPIVCLLPRKFVLLLNVLYLSYLWLQKPSCWPTKWFM